MIKGGAFQVARKLFESELWLTKPCSWNKIWIYIIGKVNHEDTSDFPRGINYFNFKNELKSIGCDITIDMVKKFLVFARKNEMLSTRRSTRGEVVSVNKYALYQGLENYMSTNKSTRQAPDKHQTSTPINNNKELRKNNTSKSNNLKLSLPLLEVLKKELKSHKLDGDYQKENLYPSETLYKLLLNDYRENYGKEPTPQDLYDEFENILKIMDDFNYKNATNILYITKHWNQIINKLKK